MIRMALRLGIGELRKLCKLNSYHMRHILEKIKKLFTCKNEISINHEMDNVVNSMFLCDPIYDKLKVKCHPDRFTNEEQKQKAEELFQLLQKHRYNYEELIKLKIQIEELIS